MRVEVLQLLKEHLAGAVTGAAARIALVPRRAGDVAPTVLTGIVEETSDEGMGSEQVPSDLPALGLQARLASEQPDAAINTEATGQITVLIRYLQRKVEAGEARAEASYTLRGTLHSLAYFFSGGGDVNRVLRGIQIINVNSITAFETVIPLGDAQVSWAIELTMTYRDYFLSL